MSAKSRPERPFQPPLRATAPSKLDKILHDKVLIVDFGSQVTQLIARRVREERVYCEIVPYQKAEAAFLEMRPKAVILSGGPASVHEKGAPLAPQAIYRGRRAGARHLLRRAGRWPSSSAARSKAAITANSAAPRSRSSADSPLFEGVWVKGQSYPVWMSHGDRVTELPPGFKVVGTSPNAPIAVIGDDKRKFYATQFHLEVVHTPHGAAILRNFVRKIAGLSGDWTMRAFKDEAIDKIRAQVGKGKVICGLSGGVDSARSPPCSSTKRSAISSPACSSITACCALAEGQKVVALFRDSYNIPLVHVDAEDMFLKALAGIDDPEQKRKIIGKLFIDVFEREAKKIGGARIPRARHALSRRDRKRVVHRRARRSPSSRTTMSAACPSA